MQEYEERYRKLIEAWPGLVCVCVEGKIATINPAGIKLLGATEPEQLLGVPLVELIHPSYRSNAGERLARLAEAGRTLPVEEKWVKLDETVVDVEVTATPLVYRGEPAIQVIAHDISQRKRTEAMLRESEDRHHRLMELYLDLIGVESARTTELHAALRRAQEVDRLKSQLLSIVSHELRTPLTSIRGQTSTLLDYADQISPAEQLEALRIVDNEAARLEELISHILDMSRLESGTLRVEPIAVDLRPILLEAVELMAAQAPRHTLQADLSTSVPLAQADPRRVRQIVLNLLDNAVKFSPHDTTITVYAEPGPTTVSVHVRDHGRGITPEHLPHIFDRFYRVEEHGVRASGVGLGLAICKGLVEAMGGRMSVASQVGQGSTFSFSLPRTQGVSSHD